MASRPALRPCGVAAGPIRREACGPGEGCPPREIRCPWVINLRQVTTPRICGYSSSICLLAWPGRPKAGNDHVVGQLLPVPAGVVTATGVPGRAHSLRTTPRVSGAAGRVAARALETATFGHSAEFLHRGERRVVPHRRGLGDRVRLYRDDARMRPERGLGHHLLARPELPAHVRHNRGGGNLRSRACGTRSPSKPCTRRPVASRVACGHPAPGAGGVGEEKK